MIRFWLWMFAATCGGGAVLAVCLATSLPLANTQPRNFVNASSSKTTADSAALPLSAFSTVWDIDLRRPLVDSPPPAPQTIEPAAPPSAPPQFHLAGTIVESGHSVALFQQAGGKTEFKQVGQQIGGATIVSIRDDSVTVQWDGRELVVPVERAVVGPASGNPVNPDEAGR